MNILRQRATWVAVALTIAFLLSAMIVPGDRLKPVYDAGRFGLALMVALVCARVAWVSFWSGARTGADQVTIAIALLWQVITLQALWVVIPHFATLPPWTPVQQVNALIPYLYMISAVFFLLPIGNRTGEMPQRNWALLFAAALIGGLVIGLMIGLGIDSLD